MKVYNDATMTSIRDSTSPESVIIYPVSTSFFWFSLLKELTENPELSLNETRHVKLRHL